MSSCPVCPQSGLKHTLISESLPAHMCPACEGLLISLVAYRQWREHVEPPKRPDRPPTNVAVEDSKDAIACSKCGSMMTKYRISSESPNRIDFCEPCEDIWLDHGEWEIVEDLAGSDHLWTILTQPWQRRIVTESIDKMEVERLQDLLGPDYEKIVELSRWLTGHASRDLILTYLRRKSHI